MIAITLKAKHLYFIAANIMYNSIFDYGDLINEIRAKTANKLDDDDVIVDVKGSQVMTLYAMFAQKPEGQVNQINTEMNAMLLPQITAEVSKPSPDQEWVDLAASVNTTRQSNWAITASQITLGKQFLHP